MITHELNAEEVSNLIKEHIYSDLDITNESEYTVIRSDDDEVYAMVKCYPTDDIILTEEEYNKVMTGARSSDYSALFIAGVPSGIFQFSLELFNLKFENYTDIEAGIDTKVAELSTQSGVQILDWYPEFASEDDYIDALMSNGDAIGFDESESW